MFSVLDFHHGLDFIMFLVCHPIVYICVVFYFENITLCDVVHGYFLPHPDVFNQSSLTCSFVPSAPCLPCVSTPSSVYTLLVLLCLSVIVRSFVLSVFGSAFHKNIVLQ